MSPRALLCVRLANGTQIFANTMEVADLLIRRFAAAEASCDPASATRVSLSTLVSQAPKDDTDKSFVITSSDKTSAATEKYVLNNLPNPINETKVDMIPNNKLLEKISFTNAKDDTNTSSKDVVDNDPFDAQGTDDLATHKAFDVSSLGPGSKIQWRNSYAQWQNAEFISYLDNGWLRIREMKNDRTSVCTQDLVRSRFDADGNPFEQQF